jgi:phospholipid-binding lipoprotein MlaA
MQRLNKLSAIFILFSILIYFNTGEVFSQENDVADNTSLYGNDEFWSDIGEDYPEDEVSIADPIEPFNRAMFYVNDKLYFYVLKPVAKGYNFVLPEVARKKINNAFYNVRFPGRFVNDLLQLKFKYASVEFGRFVVNTTVGILGLFRLADKVSFLETPPPKDTDLTFGKWGIGNGFYIVWPVFGPNTIRSTVGLAGDFFLDPITYIDPDWASLTVKTEGKLNDTSLRLGEYENFKENSMDPYVSMRNGYVKYRQNQLGK